MQREPRRGVSHMTPLWRGAHELAELGFRVFPLKPRTKTPAIRKWQERATTSSTQIRRWWTKWPDANIAIATGQGLVVLDIDSDEALDYAYENGLLDDETPTVKTGRAGDGIHRYFKDADGNAKTHMLKDGDVKIEVKANVAYVVAPPSVHPVTGALYEWFTDPYQPLALVPERAVATPQHTSQAMFDEGETRDGVLVEGERKVRLHKLASAMRGTGMLDDEIRSALATANEARCLPPLEEEHIRDIEKSALGYPVGYKPDLDLLTVERLTSKPSSLAVYIAIRDACGYRDRCRVATERLEEKAGKARATIFAAVKDLERARVIDVTRTQIRGRDQCNEYRLLELPTNPACDLLDTPPMVTAV